MQFPINHILRHEKMRALLFETGHAPHCKWHYLILTTTLACPEGERLCISFADRRSPLACYGTSTSDITKWMTHIAPR